MQGLGFLTVPERLLWRALQRFDGVLLDKDSHMGNNRGYHIIIFPIRHC